LTAYALKLNAFSRAAWTLLDPERHHGEDESGDRGYKKRLLPAESLREPPSEHVAQEDAYRQPEHEDGQRARAAIGREHIADQ
jgi:hypothetical protein